MASAKVEASMAVAKPSIGASQSPQQKTMPTTMGASTTTTLSTIAVRAEPHSTIVVAIVKSVGFVELRIDEMQPGLLQIGTTPSENAQLLLIHEDLYERLLSKQEQVEELLGRAEKLVTEQTEPDDIRIYEAMADGLATAWKSLSRQLALRGYILADTQQLYEIALKHEELAKLTNSRLNKSGKAAEMLDELQRIIDELAELTREGLEIGSTVIAQIRILGALTDNEERPREAFNSCLAIEKIMLRIAQSWEFIENSWRFQRNGQQMQALDEKIVIISEHHQQQQQNSIKNVKKDKSTSAAALDMSEANLTTAEQWLLTAAQRFERVRNDDDEEEELELHILVNEIKANYTSLKCISEQIDPVLKPTSATRCDQLLEHYNRLLKEVQMRGDLLERTQTMMQKTDMLLIQLEKMRDDLRHASAAMAGELGPLAQQKGVALIEDGVQLCAQWEREPADGAAWRAAVDKRVERLKEAVIDVVRMARDRIAAGKSDKLREMLASLEHWHHSVAGHVMSEPITLSPTAAETIEFLNRLRRFSSDLTYKEQQLRSLLASQQKLQHFVLAEEQRLDAVHAGICQIRQMVESRMKLGQTLEQLHKLSRELDTSLHFFGTLLKNEDAKNADNETAVEQHQKQLQQMRNLLQQANEHIYRERHQAEKFASLANSLNDTDPGLNIYPALDWSRATLSSHEKELSRLTKLSKQWETERQNWQNLKTSTDGTFKPRITVHLPLEHVVLAGSSLELSARAEGNPEPEIVWLKDGCSIGELTGHRRMGWLNSLATLVIEELLDEDIGEYVLIVRNALGEAESKCKLIVVQPHVPAKFANNVTTDGEIKQKHEQQATVVTTTTTVTRLESAEQKLMHEQDVHDVHARLVDEQQQQQPYKPRFVRQLENVSAREGAPFTLDCVVVGNPEPKIIWYREEQTVLESDRFRLAFRGDHCALSCSEARTEDAGLYKVLAVNMHGETMNFCRVCIVPPSPKRNRVAPPTARKPVTPILARRVEPDELVPEIVTVPNDTVLPVTDVPPVIEPQLSSQVVREGQSVNFQVRIKGVPKPGVRWFYNGSPIDDDRQDLVLSKDSEDCHVLNIPRVALGHAGQYTVEAQNKAGRERSSATLNVLLGFEETTTKTTATTTTATTSPTSGFDSPQFGSHWFQQHSHQNNLFGEPTKVEINNDHRQMFDQRSWSRQSFGSSPRGIVYAVSKSDRAESRRSSDFEDPGLGYSSLANAPEFIRTFQAEVTINEGERFEVDCLMVGNPRPKIHWFFNDRPVKSSPGFFELTNVGDTYTIRFTPARLECAGYYRLYAENIRGRAEAQTLIHVRPKSMIPKPLQQRRSLGDARVGGMHALVRIQRERQWAQQQQKRALSTPPQPLFIDGRRSATTAADSPLFQQQQQLFAYKQHQQQQQQQFPATVPSFVHLPNTNGKQQVKSAASSLHKLMDAEQIRHLTPPQPKGSAPHFIQTLVSVVAPEGQNARFEAVVTGLPQPRIEWSKNGEPMVENENVYFWAEAGRDYLVVEKTGSNDVGKYCCTAENSFGMASSSAQLLLRAKTIAPDFVQRLVSEEVEEGMPLKWTVQVSGDPEPTVKWLLDGQQIEGAHDGVRFVQQDLCVHHLFIDDINLSDAGQYTCVLENGAGEARSTADLVVRRKGTVPGKYVHVTKVTQERHQRGEEVAQQETIVVADEIEEENGIDENEK